MITNNISEQFNLLRISIHSAMTKGVKLHDSIAGKVDALIKTKNDIDKNNLGILPSDLSGIDVELKEISSVYKDLRNMSLVLEYLSGHSIYTICRDFKLTKPTVRKIIINYGVTLRDE